MIDLVFRAFNEWGVARYYTSDHYEQFGIASSLLMSALNEIAGPLLYAAAERPEALEVYDRASYRSSTCKSWPWRSWPGGRAPNTCATAAMRC